MVDLWVLSLRCYRSKSTFPDCPPAKCACAHLYSQHGNMQPVPAMRCEPPGPGRHVGPAWAQLSHPQNTSVGKIFGKVSTEVFYTLTTIFTVNKQRKEWFSGIDDHSLILDKKKCCNRIEKWEVKSSELILSTTCALCIITGFSAA